MKVLYDIPISLTSEYVLQEQGRHRQKSVSSALVAAANEAVAIGEPLLAPAVVYDEFLVRDGAAEQVILSSLGTHGSVLAEGDRLTVGPKTDLLAPAERLMVAVYTIGPALERRVHALEAAGQMLLAYMLDTVGVLALGAVGGALRDKVQERAAELDWGVSPALSPGSLVGWPLNGQRELCALLPLEKISVRLNSYCVLEPHKSVSMVIGLGSGYESNHVGSVCRYCSLAGSCWRRRGDGA